MTNFIFKSASRLIKNSPITLEILHSQLYLIQRELRAQRQEHRDISIKLEKLLIDKHLQMQVDDYFKEDDEETSPQTDQDEHFEDKPGDVKVGI